MTADLRDLALLVDVVDTGSITAGAERSALSLSAASVRVAGLERHFGVRLLDRNRRGVTATPDGAAVVEHARRLLAAAAEMEAAVAARARGIDRVLRIAVGSASVDALPEFLAAALNRMPQVCVDLVELSSLDAVEAVREGQVELAVASSAAEVRGCQVETLWDDDLVVIGPRSTGERPPLDLVEALADPVVALSADVPLQRLVERHARAAGLEPTYRVRFPSLAAVCAVAATGVGRAIVPRLSARQHGVPDACVHPLAEPWARRTALLIARDLDALDPTAARFVDLLRAHSREHGRDVAGRA